MGRWAVVLAGFAWAFCGCNRTPPKASVAGDVLVDGQPLDSGLIRFVPLSGESQASDAPVKAGKFLAEGVPVGDVRVEITAPKVVGKRKMYDTPDSPAVDDVRERLPERYNAASELKFTVAEGKNEKTFELKAN